MQPPVLTQFRLEPLAPGFGHLVFDTPDRRVNVLSTAALHEVETVAEWLAHSGLKGLVLSSAKPSGFSAGADLDEVAPVFAAMAEGPSPSEARALQARFPPFTRALRRLETAGVPVVAAIRGGAFGGALELALACHGRIMADTPDTLLALPEVGIGLFAAGGGSQRLPRLIGLPFAAEVLLEGRRLSPAEALACGAADRVAPAGEEVTAALDWLRTGPDPRQPWDRGAGHRADPAALAALRAGHGQALSPAVAATLDALDQGLSLEMTAANAVEVALLFRLLQRPEPHAMLATRFHGRVARQKAQKTGMPDWLEPLLVTTAGAIGTEADRIGRGQAVAAATRAGFTRPLPEAGPAPAGRLPPGRIPVGEGILNRPEPGWQADALRLLAAVAQAAWAGGAVLPPSDRRLFDHAAAEALGLPDWAGGPLWLAENMGASWCARVLP